MKTRVTPAAPLSHCGRAVATTIEGSACAGGAGTAEGRRQGRRRRGVALGSVHISVGGTDMCTSREKEFKTRGAGELWDLWDPLPRALSCRRMGSAVVMLKDKKTVFVVMRKDGGDGVPHHYHVPYV